MCSISLASVALTLIMIGVVLFPPSENSHRYFFNLQINQTSRNMSVSIPDNDDYDMDSSVVIVARLELSSTGVDVLLAPGEARVVILDDEGWNCMGCPSVL